MKRPLLLIFLAFMCLNSLYASYPGEPLPSMAKFRNSLAPKQFDKDKLVWGGTFGATFGTTTFVDLSPLAGYRITDDFIAGVGVTYMYFRQRYQSQAYETSIYGGRIFLNYSILENVFVHAEYEGLNYDRFDFLTQENKRSWFFTPLIGGGYSQPISDRASFRIFALYALNSQDSRSPYYNNPLVFRVGVFL